MEEFPNLLKEVGRVHSGSTPCTTESKLRHCEGVDTRSLAMVFLGAVFGWVGCCHGLSFAELNVSEHAEEVRFGHLGGMGFAVVEDSLDGGLLECEPLSLGVTKGYKGCDGSVVVVAIHIGTGAGVDGFLDFWMQGHG
jgi:hypothetical protein